MAPKALPEPERDFKGVYKNCGLWRARVWNVDHEVYVGHFNSAREAGKAYDRAAIRIKGPECANMDGLNFPYGSYVGEISGLMACPAESVLANLRSSGVTVNPLDPDIPLR
eukprot:jgi/Ulvmu1/6825/UM031_0029.1